MCLQWKLDGIAKKWLRNEDGATAIEAAICLPIILTLIFACFQYGIYFDKATDINHDFQDASRRVKLMDNPTDSQLLALYQAAIDQTVSEDVTLSVDRVNRYGETFAEVNMTYAYTIDIPFLEKYPLTSSYQNLIILSEDI